MYFISGQNIKAATYSALSKDSFLRLDMVTVLSLVGEKDAKEKGNG